MDRTRRSSSSSISSMPFSNPLPRRRHPTISLRGSSPVTEEGRMELQETVRLKSNKRERDWSKRKRPSNSHTTEEESVGNEHHCDLQESRLLSSNTTSSASDQNHRGRTSIDQVIGARVPRRTRSASVKRAHHSWVEEQSAEAASPSSSNVSLPKKMKSVGPKTTLPKTASSSTQEDIEIEIAELLYGLRTSQNHDSSSQKLEVTDSRPPRSTTPSSYHSIDAEKKKVEGYSSSTLPPNNSTAESVRIEGEQQPAKTEKPSPRMSGCHEIGSVKENIEEHNLNAGAGCGDTADRRSESKLDVNNNKHHSVSTRGVSDVSGGNGPHKFEIDLMAPPPMTLSPESDNLSRGEDDTEVESFVNKEKTQGEIEEVKIKYGLEKPNKHNDLATNHESEEQGRNKEQPITTSTSPKVEKTVQSSSVPLSTAVSERPNSLSPLEYMPPLGTVVKMDKIKASLTTQQQVNFLLSQPRPKRCATHYYITCNIFMHQQCTKMNTFLPSAVGCGSVCDTKLNNVNRMNSAESVVVGKQSHKHSPGMNQNAAQEKGWTATSDYSLATIRSSGSANSMDSMQMKQLVHQQGLHPGSSGNLVHGPAFLFPPGQNQASLITGTSQAAGVNSSSSASSSNKFCNSVAGSHGRPTLPAVAAAMSFSYPNLAANDAPFVTIVQNSGYPFPFSSPLGASAAIRGASSTQSTPMLNGPLYSSQIFHPLPYPQQHLHSQPPVQPSYLNASTPSVSSSSHKQSQGTQVNGKNILTSATMQLQQSQKQHRPSLSHPQKHETGMAGENAQSVASGTAYSQKNVFGQNFMIPVQPMSLSFTPSATSDINGANSGNFGDKQQQQHALKGGVEQIPSQAFAISFANYNGNSVPSNLNFSSMAQNPMIFQSLPDMAWQGYQAATTSHTTQQNMCSITDGKSGGNSSNRDDEKKANSGKPSTNGPTTLVFDNSSKNLNFVSSPVNGNWPSRSCISTATTTSLPLSSNASNSQQPPQLLHLQQQHGKLLQQPAVATRYKASSTNATAAAKILHSPPVYSQNQTQCKSSNQGSQSKNLGRTPDSQVHNTSIITSTTPSLQSFSQDQGRAIQGHTQISFGGNYLSSLPVQGQQPFNNNQPLCTTVAGTPPSGGNSKTNSQGSKVGSSVNTSQMQQTENSSAGTGQKSSPVCGRNVPSILSSCPSHLSELKY